MMPNTLPPRQLNRSMLRVHLKFGGHNMKTVGLSIVLLLIVTVSSAAQSTTQNFGLPELHSIKTVRCRRHTAVVPPNSFKRAMKAQLSFYRGIQNSGTFLSCFSMALASQPITFSPGPHFH